MRLKIYILFAIVVSSCAKDHAFDCFTPNGKTETITRSLPPFKKLEVFDNFDITIVQSNAWRVEITGAEHVLKGIETEVNDSLLTIRNLNSCNFVRGYKRPFSLRIYTPFVQEIVNEGVAVVRMDENFTQDSLSAKVGNSGDFYLNGNYRIVKTVSTGNGDMYLKGKVETLYVFTTGVNYVYGKDLQISKYMFIHTLTLGDCLLSAGPTTEFAYNIQGKGNIYLYGTPKGIYNASEPGYTGQLIVVPN